MRPSLAASIILENRGLPSTNLSFEVLSSSLALLTTLTPPPHHPYPASRPQQHSHLRPSHLHTVKGFMEILIALEKDLFGKTTMDIDELYPPLKPGEFFIGAEE